MPRCYLMGTPDQQKRLDRLQVLLDKGVITVEEADRVAAGLGLKGAFSKWGKAKQVGSYVGIAGLVLGAAADAASIFYPVLSGPIGAAVKIVNILGSWF